MNELLLPRGPETIRARARWWAVLWMVLAEVACSFVIAAPIHAWAQTVWGAHPDGDGILWAAGGREFVAWLGGNDPTLSVVSRTGLVLLLVSALAMQLPLGALFASLAFDRGGSGQAPRFRTALRVGITAFAPLAGLLVLGSVVSGILLFLSGTIAAGVYRSFGDRLGDARSFQLALIVFALGACITIPLGIVMDLARAAVGRGAGLPCASETASTTTMWQGLAIAFQTAKRRTGDLTLAWGWRSLLSIGLVVAGSVLTSSLGGRSGGALIALWAVHQGIVLARGALRASWLARALEAIAPVQDARQRQASDSIASVAAR